MALLSAKDLSVRYQTEDGPVYAVEDASFEVETNSIVGILGESGCGKSTLVKSLIKGLPQNGRIVSGEIHFDGEDLTEMSEKEIRALRWERIAYIPQSAMGSLDPVFTIRSQLIETIQTHRPKTSKSEALERCREVMEFVGIDPGRLKNYPHQLSGGMRQRVLLAMSILLEPDLIIADEPTTGLDVLIRDKILNDLETYRDELGISIIFVTHDIADLVETSNELLVMYGGRIVEKGPSMTVFENPTHPYTIGLRGALPELHENLATMLDMGMNPPDLKNPPDGCIFLNKCPFKTEECFEEHPPLQETGGGKQTACYWASDAERMRQEASTVEWPDSSSAKAGDD